MKNGSSFWLLILVSGLALCSPQDYSDIVVLQEEPIPQVVLKGEQITQENLQITLPSNDWIGEEATLPEFKIMMKSPDDKNTVLFLKEDTLYTFENYVVSAFETFSDSSVTVDFIHQVVVNDQNYIYAQLTKTASGMRVWTWITTKGDHGYEFSCNAEINVDAGDSPREMCESVANTIHIN
jgi:hypothetical protein